MKVTIVEGTPEEILKAFPNITLTPTSSSQGSILVGTSPESPPPPARNGRTCEDVEILRRVLSRIRLSPEQLKVLQAMYNAYPGQILASELQREIGYTPSQFAGLMGAFGRRISHTPGWPDGEWFFMQEWNYDAGCVSYGLSEAVRQAMRLEKLI